MKLESRYLRTTALGLTRGGNRLTPALGLTPAEQYVWRSDGKCVDVTTGEAYPGDQRLSNCQQLHGPYKTPTGKGAVYDFLRKTFLGEGRQQGPMPQPSVTGPSLLVPAVVVVGGVALFLILRKKK